MVLPKKLFLLDFRLLSVYTLYNNLLRYINVRTYNFDTERFKGVYIFNGFLGEYKLVVLQKFTNISTGYSFNIF